MLKRGPLTGELQLLALRQMVRGAVRRKRDANVSWLALAERHRTKDKNTSEEDAFRWTSCATWQ